ncbi:hypothetical protein CO046_00345 [Candidatus Peregrinibacteria bacterium CG_4_9_14_0_2_um_filter_53_11]|nr:MAG: hypothetical protein CO046_00345 [Candidatus Peregrinibacteria bacterium CG_4_9_14_0_2_um_filter_53_11]
MKNFFVGLFFFALGGLSIQLLYSAELLPSQRVIPTEVGDEQTEQPVTNQPAVPQSQNNEQATADYDYVSELNWDAEITTDIFRINRATGKRELFVKDAYSQVPASAEPETINRAFNILAHPFRSGSVILTVTIPDSDAGYGDLYKLNEETKAITKMRINEVWKGGLSNYKISPDATRILYTDWMSPSVLWICDLTQDSCTKKVSLGVAESFDGGSGGLGASYDLRWTTEITAFARYFDTTEEIVGETDPGRIYQSLGFKEVSVY